MTSYYTSLYCVNNRLLCKEIIVRKYPRNPLDYWMDAGQTQPPGSATEEHLGADDSASDDMGRAAAKSRATAENQWSASASLHQRKRRTL